MSSNFKHVNRRAIGCAFPSPTFCTILIVSDAALEAARYTYGIVLRHEIGHCNGWDAHHTGARAWSPTRKELLELFPEMARPA